MVNHAIFADQNNIWLALEGKGLIYRNVTTKHDEIIIADFKSIQTTT